MGDWNDGVMVYNIYFLLLYIPQSTIYTPQSEGVTLCYGS